jgi:hypothetical protein
MDTTWVPQDDRHEHQADDSREGERDLPGRVQVLPEGAGPAPPVGRRGERADAGPERETGRSRPSTNLRSSKPVAVPKMLLNMNRPAYQ